MNAVHTDQPPLAAIRMVSVPANQPLPVRTAIGVPMGIMDTLPVKVRIYVLKFKSTINNVSVLYAKI